MKKPFKLKKDLEADLIALSDVNHAKQHKIDTLQNNVTTLKRKLGATKADYVSLEEKYNQLRKDLSSMKHNCRDLTKENKLLCRHIELYRIYLNKFLQYPK